MNVPRLRIVGGPFEQTIELREQKVQIGRGRDNDLVLPDADKGVSRVHAEIRHENGRYVIVDLQSQNGTWVNGRRVERAELPAGAEIAVGEYRLTLLEDVNPLRGARTASVPPPAVLDELRMREPPAPDPFVSSGPAVASAAHRPRWAAGAAIAVVAIIVLAGVAWVSRSRSDPSSATGAGAPASVPPSTHADPPTNDAAAPASIPAATAVVKHVPESTVPNADRGAEAVRVGRKPGESTDAWRARTAAIQMRYSYSKAALQRGDFAAAAGGFEAILMDEPGFLDAPQLLVEAQAGLRGSARNLYKAGTRLDAAGDWMGALQKYEQARQISAGIPGLAESLQRVREKLRVAGTNAFNQARQLEASGRSQDAVKAYEKAIQWLPPDDPNRHLAQARVEQLRRN